MRHFRSKRMKTFLTVETGRGMVIMVVFLVLTVLFVPGCPPLNDEARDVLSKALENDGCRGCGGCNPEEGEGEAEGEGETAIEGEGEDLPEGEEYPEGEGEMVLEGEGEVIPEGEGEATPEGEGEAPNEGEGEETSEGEGEVMNEGEGEVMPEGEGEVLNEGEGETTLEGEGEPEPLLDCPPDSVFSQDASLSVSAYYFTDMTERIVALDSLIVDLGEDVVSTDDDEYISDDIYGVHWWGVECDADNLPCAGDLGTFAIWLLTWNVSKNQYEPTCEWNNIMPSREPANFSVTTGDSELPVYSYTAQIDPPCFSLTGEPVYINIRQMSSKAGKTEGCRFGWLATDQGVDNQFMIISATDEGATTEIMEGNLAVCLITDMSEGEGEVVLEGEGEEMPEGEGELLLEGEGEGEGEIEYPEMVLVPAGTFAMGRPYPWTDVWESEGEEEQTDELPVHSVSLDTYMIGKYEVTNQEYCDVLNWALGQGYLKDATGEDWLGTGSIYAVSGEPYILVDLERVECNIQYLDGAFYPKTRMGLPEITSYSMENHPMLSVSWYGSAAYCNWLNEIHGLTPCYNMATVGWDLVASAFAAGGYRLPTEAEWERAAAWDGIKHWVYGCSSDVLDAARCNFYLEALVNPLGLAVRPFTSPVGWFDGVNISPNGEVSTIDGASPSGVYDMSGNVWEWCHDWYGPYTAEAQTNPTGPATGTERVFRGGSFEDLAGICRSAERDKRPPDKTPYKRGFRIVQSVK